ncbi:hypothetical protein ACWGI0_35195 [Streptomyces sp. NPDC054802]
MAPELSIDVIRRALRRTSYDEDREREAELVATIILEWASVVNRVSPQSEKDPSVHQINRH